MPPSNFDKTVTSASTPEAIYPSSVKVATLIIQALSTNSGIVNVLGPGITGQGIMLGKPASSTSTPDAAGVRSEKGDNEIDISDYYLRTSIDGEGASIFIVKK